MLQNYNFHDSYSLTNIIMILNQIILQRQARRLRAVRNLKIINQLAGIDIDVNTKL
jgi:hypothetical protein